MPTVITNVRHSPSHVTGITDDADTFLATSFTSSLLPIGVPPDGTTALYEVTILRLLGYQNINAGKWLVRMTIGATGIDSLAFWHVSGMSTWIFIDDISFNNSSYQWLLRFRTDQETRSAYVIRNLVLLAHP